MDYHYYQKKGAYHENRGMSCEDAYLIAEDSACSLIALADGVSACAFGKCGAEKALEALLDFVQREGEAVFSHGSPKLAYLLLEHVLYYLELEAVAKQADLREFSSTLAFACIDKKTGRTVIGNLGDGSAIAVLQDTFKPISGPGRPAHHLFVTTSKFAARAMSIQHLELSPGDSLLLGTDGFVHAALSMGSGGTGIFEMLRDFDFRELDSFLDTFPEADDCTCVAVRC